MALLPIADPFVLGFRSMGSEPTLPTERAASRTRNLVPDAARSVDTDGATFALASGLAQKA